MKKPILIIAEAGVNHNGDMSMAKQLIDVAVDAGADLVKFQTFSADRLATPEAEKADYQIAATESFETQHEMLGRLEHRLAPFTSCPRMDLTAAESLAQRLINIPSSPSLVGNV